MSNSLSANLEAEYSPIGMVLVRWPYVKAYRTSTMAGNKTSSSSKNGSIVKRHLSRMNSSALEFLQHRDDSGVC